MSGKTSISVEETASKLGVTCITVRRWIQRGWLEAENVGSVGTRARYTISETSLNKFINGKLKERWSSLRGENWKRIHKKI